MAGSVNKAIIIGHVGKDPEIRSTQDGKKIANLSLATSESWTDRASGERKERTEWHRVSVFNERIADVVERYVTKGSLLYVEGPIRTRKWTDQSGADRYSTEVCIENFRGELTILGDRSGSGAREGVRKAAEPADRHRPTPGAKPPPPPPGGLEDDEIPF